MQVELDLDELEDVRDCVDIAAIRSGDKDWLEDLDHLRKKLSEAIAKAQEEQP